MKHFVLLLILISSSSYYAQTSKLIGTWESSSSINKKYNSNNCVTKDTEITLNFKSNNKLEYRVSNWPPNYYSEWNFSYDKVTNLIKLSSGKQFPDGTDLLNLEYKVLFVDYKALHLNQCLCIFSEKDKSSDSKCLTKFKKIK